MSLAMGQKMKIRSMIYVAAEPVPYFWPMRAFIHHNPLHGLEGLPFEQAVEKGASLFHGQVFLPRANYQHYVQQGKVDERRLSQEIEGFLSRREPVTGVDMHTTLKTLLTRVDTPVMISNTVVQDDDIHAALLDKGPGDENTPSKDEIADRLRSNLLGERPLYETVDALCGTELGSNLDELVIKSCLDFFDEGQSVWRMPNREQGFFTAWRQQTRLHR